METSFRRALGLYFVVSSLQYVPTALLMFGVGNAAGPNLVLAAIPLMQGLITAAAGVFLLRARPSSDDAHLPSIVLPPIESILQTFGIIFIVDGFVWAARPLSGLLFFNEVWSISVGGSLAAAGASLAAGWFLLVRPVAFASLMKRKATA